MHIHDEDIDGVRGFRISGLPDGETVQIIGEGSEDIQKWSIAVEILRLIKHRLKDRVEIPETMIPLGDRPNGNIGFFCAKDPDSKLAIRLTWVHNKVSFKFSTEIWPKGRSAPWVLDTAVETKDLGLPARDFSNRYLMPVAAVLANCLMESPKEPTKQ